MKNDQHTDVNELILTGLIVSQVRYHRDKCVFTLENCNGRFFVLWRNPEWQPERGQHVMIHGEIYSVFRGQYHNTRVRAKSVTALQAQGEAYD